MRQSRMLVSQKQGMDLQITVGKHRNTIKLRDARAMSFHVELPQGSSYIYDFTLTHHHPC